MLQVFIINTKKVQLKIWQYWLLLLEEIFLQSIKYLTLNLSNGTVENTITIIISLNLTMEQMALKRVILMHQDLT